MAFKPTKIDAEKQVKAGDSNDLFAVKAGKPEWVKPAEVGVATEAYADSKVVEAVSAANDYTNNEIDLAKGEMQNYTDDKVSAAEGRTDLKLADKADLSGGKVPASQLPGFAETFQVYPTLADFPETGDDVVIYVAEDTNESYRWTGATYSLITGGTEIGETSETAYRGDRGKIAYDHTLDMDNPHMVNKTQVGLSNVDNTSDAEKVAAGPISAALASKAGSDSLSLIQDDVAQLKDQAVLEAFPGMTPATSDIPKFGVNSADGNLTVSTSGLSIGAGPSTTRTISSNVNGPITIDAGTQPITLKSGSQTLLLQNNAVEPLKLNTTTIATYSNLTSTSMTMNNKNISRRQVTTGIYVATPSYTMNLASHDAAALTVYRDFTFDVTGISSGFNDAYLIINRASDAAHTITFGSSVKRSTEFPSATLTITPGKLTIVKFMVISSSDVMITDISTEA